MRLAQRLAHKLSVLALLLGTADGLRIGAWYGRAHALARCHVLAAELPISTKSSLADIRAFVSENGLDVKTSGPGRTKAAIISEVESLFSGAPVAVDEQQQEPPLPPPPPEEAVEQVAKVVAADQAKPAVTEAQADAKAAEDMGQAPDGFEWGGVF